ncbi:MAG: class I SAM-dependent methyltransferase [Prolixibacteraceae bacterium]|nr:class I SAM-dependent methyltransferase [Prolixibacteraceae bacterium]
MATKAKKVSVCPVEIAGGLDNSIRRFLQNPQKILKPHIIPGMKVLDMGCGPGFFTIEIAKLLNGSGKVIAADLQNGMLEIVSHKIMGTELEQIIQLHQCQSESIGLTEKVDFVLAFYVVHEVPNPDNLLRELKAILNHDGRIFIVEPNFHVTGKEFKAMLEKAKNIGFEIADRPKSFLNRAVVLTLKKV